MNELLKDKNILIMGVANKWSIAWGIAESCIRAGARLILTYQNKRTKAGIEQLTGDMSDVTLYPCDEIGRASCRERV